MTIYNNNLPLCHWWQQLMLPLRACSHLNLSPPLASMAKGDINCISSQCICKQLPLSTCILIIWFCGPVQTNSATYSLSPLGSSMDPRCLRSERTSSLVVYMTTIISIPIINLSHMQLFCLLHPHSWLSLLCNNCLLTATWSTVYSSPLFISSSGWPIPHGFSFGWPIPHGLSI